MQINVLSSELSFSNKYFQYVRTLLNLHNFPCIYMSCTYHIHMYTHIWVCFQHFKQCFYDGYVLSLIFLIRLHLGSSPLRKTFVNMAIRWTKFNIIKSNEINRPRSNYKGKIDSFVTELPNHGRYHGNLPMIERDREQLSANFLMEHINVEQRNLIVVLMMDLGISTLRRSIYVHPSLFLLFFKLF
jgi:hypothetical protein